FNFKSEFIGKLEKYTKEFDKFWCNDCTFKISDSNFYCLEHGSIDEKSPFYTQGYPIKSYKEILKRKELKKKAREEMESRAKYYPILASYGFLCALKFFIFIFVV
ncbi:MAG: hypothetical protein II567_02000, partial [Candidatus Riflebacteria bacterium]|nr:hypothetical protein [Candidatus Riflebacteria bacterium]